MNDLTLIPTEVPAYAISTELARSMNEDASVGISTGFPASIRIKQGKFRLVDGNGDETILKPAELAEGEYLPLVVLAAKRGLNKVYYATAYDPNQSEPSAPDCFSLDGERPDASVKKPMCSTCAACPMNAFGSGRNAAGQPTKGKACSDNKILAVLYKGGVYQFKIPPASLKNWGVFVKNLTARGIPLGHVAVYTGFDDAVDYSVLTFRVGRFIEEEKLPKLAAYVSSVEVSDIIHPSYTPAAALAAKPSPKALEQTMAKAAKKGTEVVEIPRRGRPKKDEKEAAVPTDDELTDILGL